MARDKDFEERLATAQAEGQKLRAQLGRSGEQIKGEILGLKTQGFAGYFRALPLWLRVAGIAALVLFVALTVVWIGDQVTAWRYQNKVAEATAKADAREKEASSLKAESDALLQKSNEKDARISELQTQLDAANLQLAESNKQLVTLSVATVNAKVTYGKARENPRIDMYLTGNADADRQRLWAEYQRLKAEAGH